MNTDSTTSNYSNLRFLLNVCLKTGLLFIAINLAFATLQPIPWLEQWSAYNLLFPGRVRLPYGENPEKAYNLSLYQMKAMLAAHEVAAPKGEDEFRVMLIGDSSVWGFLLQPDNTLSSLLNDAEMMTPKGQNVRFYNLGYPTISLSKDLLILEKAMQYEPDLIIWLVTLEAMPRSRQFESPIVQNNAPSMRRLIERYDLQLDPDDAALVELDFWQQTIIGRRRALADLLRLQLYGVMWAATGVDQYYPERYDPPVRDLQAELEYHSLTPPLLKPEDLALDVLMAGISLSSPAPVLLVNEPVYISDGENSDIRYNFFYPRWAYDHYRQMLAELSQKQGWQYLDAWDLIPAQEFTNSAIHYNPSGSAMLAKVIEQALEPMLR